MNFGDRVKEARQRAQISQSALARRAEMSLQGVAKIEQGGVADPHYSTLHRLAEALEVNPLWLATGVEEKEPVPLVEAPEGAEDDYDAPEFTDGDITRVAEGVRESAKHSEVVNVIESLEVAAEFVEHILECGRYDLKEIWYLRENARAVYADYRSRRKRLLGGSQTSAPRLHELLQQADARMKSARDAVIKAYDARLKAEKDKARVAEVDELEKMRQRKRADREDLAERSA